MAATVETHWPILALVMIFRQKFLFEIHQLLVINLLDTLTVDGALLPQFCAILIRYKEFCANQKLLKNSWRYLAFRIEPKFPHLPHGVARIMRRPRV